MLVCRSCGDLALDENRLDALEGASNAARKALQRITESLRIVKSAEDELRNRFGSVGGSKLLVGSVCINAVLSLISLRTSSPQISSNKCPPANFSLCGLSSCFWSFKSLSSSRCIGMSVVLVFHLLSTDHPSAVVLLSTQGGSSPHIILTHSRLTSTPTSPTHIPSVL